MDRDIALSYGNKFKKLFIGPRGGRYYSMKFKEELVEVYPEIYSNDDRLALFLHEMKSFLDTFSLSRVERGIFIGAPILNDSSKLLTQAGTVRPLSFSAKRLVGSEREISELFNETIKKVVELRYSQGVSEDRGSISNKSSSGVPYFRTDTEYKLAHVHMLVSNGQNIKKLLAEKDLNSLYDKYSVALCCSTQIRRQPDKWSGDAPKTRNFSSFLEALNGGSDTNYPRDILLARKGAYPLGSCRTRTVAAYAAPINYFMTTIFGGIRSKADEVFSFTYKHRTPEEVSSKLKKFGYFKGLDVTSFDNSVSYPMFVAWLDALPFDQWVKDCINMLALAPHFDSDSKMASGDPLDSTTFRYWSGIPSGIFCTSALGKDIMTAAILSGYQRHIGKRLSHHEIATILVGNGKLGILNQGDDSVIMTNSDSIDDIISAIGEETGLKVEEEEGLAFLGNLYYSLNGCLKSANNLTSYIVGMYVPERSIHTKLRPFPILGARVRRNIYETHPFFNKVFDKEKELFKSIFGLDLLALEGNHLKYPKNVTQDILSYSDIDVITSPERLYYKYGQNDININIRKLFMASIPKDLSDSAMKLAGYKF